ncbi:MAG: hypothetical protein BGN96_15505 [Bacteroidales bacterium 45-6]|nr:MAG: hypothetical protein BGN96_15505 [Bacteroidales bacterium 45-6]
MKVFVLIYQRPLLVKTYSSLSALIEDNDLDEIGASRSKLEKYPFNKFNYVSNRAIIIKSQTLTAGDVRKQKLGLINK